MAEKRPLVNYSGSTQELAAVDVLPASAVKLPSNPSIGDILYYDGTTWVSLPAGTSGQYLKTLGSGEAPVWATVETGGVSLGMLLALGG